MDWSGSTHPWIDENTHCLSEEKSAPVSQCPHIDQLNSPAIGRKMGTSQGAPTLGGESSLSVRKKSDQSGSAYTSMEEKLTSCWKKKRAG
jgi:hypothetical protein